MSENNGTELTGANEAQDALLFVVLVVQCVGVAVMAVLVLLSAEAVWEMRWRRGTLESKLVYTICAAFSFALLEFSLGASMTLGAFQDCAGSFRALQFIYLCAKACEYVFLYLKAKTVLSAMPVAERSFAVLQWLYLACTLAIVPVFGTLEVLFFTGVSSGPQSKMPGACIPRPSQQFSVQAFVGLMSLFVLCDFALGIQAMILFVVPLRQHLARVKMHMVPDNFLLRAVRIALMWGFLVVSLTFVALTSYAVFAALSVAPTPMADPNVLRLTGFLFGAIEALVCPCILGAMTIVWLPRRLQDCVKKRQRTSRLLDGSKRSSKNSRSRESKAMSTMLLGIDSAPSSRPGSELGVMAQAVIGAGPGIAMSTILMGDEHVRRPSSDDEEEGDKVMD